MAKKQAAGKGGKGAAATRKAMRDDTNQALAARAAIASMKRAISVLEGSLDDDSPTLGQGSYPVALDITIAGDITIGACKVTPAKEKLAFEDRDLLAAILAGEKDDQVERTIADAVRRLADAPKDGDLRVKIEGAKSLIDTHAMKAAKAKRLVKQIDEKTSSGATSGSPHVEVTGTIGLNDSDVELVMDV